MAYRYLIWNIRAMGDRRYEFPTWLCNYLKNVEIIILTEFRIGLNWLDFYNELSKEYDIYVSPYSSESLNQVCIALKKDKFDVLSVRTVDIKDVNIPEYLELLVKDKDNKEFSIIGTRIKSQTDTKLEQYEYLNDVIANKEICFCGGDFNCDSSYLKEYITAGIVYGPRTKDNKKHSFVFENGNRIGLDWIISKGLNKISNPYSDKRESPYATYDWNFVINENGYGNKTKDDFLGIKGLPDHAILKGEFEV